MTRISDERITELLAGPHQAVLSVGRLDKGPLAIPMSYRYLDGEFVFVTPPDTLHSRLMVKRGRATMTVQEALSDGLTVDQWYVIAEGPVRFTDADPMPHVRFIMAKDRGSEHADVWAERSDPSDSLVAVLTPERISGYEFHQQLD
jgi:nitroimidazol reductase NimA-like FMN-containing flavoprotein (pyridoxamine 5'-phosphate oxidase superfamily)